MSYICIPWKIINKKSLFIHRKESSLIDFYKKEYVIVYMRAKQKQDQLKNKITSVTGMPDEVILGASVINILGYHKLYIENYRGILEYTSCLIRIQTKQAQIRVVGKKLKIEYYTNLEMKITGDICSIEFCK